MSQETATRPSSDLLKSAYEVARDKQIRENLQVLMSIGLAPQQPPRKRFSTQVVSASQPTNKRRRLVAKPPVRFSKRIRKQEPDVAPLGRETSSVRVLASMDQSKWNYTQMNTALEFKLERLIKMHQDKGTTYKNPTATYDHTWMRVRSMCDTALKRRIRVIERALGQHCIVKMRMFAEVLILAGKDELGKLAQETLDRLIQKVGMTPEEAARGPRT